MKNISLKKVSARIFATALLLMGSLSASAQYYLNVYEKSGSNNQYEIANLDSVSITDVKEIDNTPVLTRLIINRSEVNLETGGSTTLSIKGYDSNGVEMTLENLQWKSDNYSVASIDENGVVRTYQSGDALIIAFIGDIADTCIVKVVDHTYTIADVVKIALDRAGLNLETGQGDSLSAIGFSSNGIEIPLINVVWKSNNPDVASVNDNGTIKTYKSGTALIIASLGSISDTCTLTVADHVYTIADVETITLDKDTLKLETGESGSLRVKGFSLNGIEIPLEGIDWRSNDYTVASVDDYGVVRTYKSGTAFIIASLGDISDTCVISVKDHVYTLAEVVKLSLDKVGLNVETGVGDSLSVKGFAADGTEIQLEGITWRSSNTSVATVTENGVVATHKSGNSLIIASLGSISDTCKVTVVDHVYTLTDVVIISINKDTLDLETGQSGTLSVKGFAADGTEIALKNILWRCSDTSIATVDENGLVKAQKKGAALITASFGVISDTCTLVIVDHVYTLSEVVKVVLDQEKLNLETTDNYRLNVSGYAADGVQIPLEGIVWESSNTTVATVDDNGVVSALSKGTAFIISSLGAISDTCFVTVKDKYVAIDVTIDSLAKSGVYMGVIGFNKELYSKPISLLNTNSKNAIDSFIDSMEMKNGTLLCYSVDNAIDSLGSSVLPDNISKVAVVTFTDGLDLGSIDMIEAVTGKYYDSDDEYLDAIHHKISTYSLADIPITAYSVGVRGSDVKDLSKFKSTLKKLASSDNYAIEVNNMSDLNNTFKAIADSLNKSMNYQNVTINVQGLNNGTRVRITCDNVSDAAQSSLYIEGTYNRRDRSLTDVEYHGLESSSGTTVAGTQADIITISYTFENILTNNNILINKAFINEWYLTSDGLWQPNSEIEQDQIANIELAQKSLLIMLVLDCSSSLGDDFGTAKNNAKNFINTMYSAAGGDGANIDNGDNYNDNFSLYSKTPLHLSLAVSIDGVRYYITQEQYSKANLKKAIIEGLTVVFGGESFIIALQDENIGSIIQPLAINYFGSKLPTVSQGEVISTCWSYINNALTSFGGSQLNSRFWTGYKSGSNMYYVYSGGGSISSTTSSTSYPVRLVTSTTTTSPIIWRDDNDLSLVAFKDGVKYNFSSVEWDGVVNKDLYDVQGLLVTAGEFKFVIALQNEAIDNITQAVAINYYNFNLPSEAQGNIIAIRWSSINSALSKFGGTAMSGNYWTGFKSGSYQYYISSSGVKSTTSSNTYAVRLVFPYTEYVDLGLSVKWATCNVGSSSPIDYGNYYSWGETETKSSYDVTNYKFRSSGDTYTNTILTKYNWDDTRGVVDNKRELDDEDDVAHVKLGGNWRMPTYSEYKELVDSCTWTWTTFNGVVGYRITSNVEGFKDCSIFLPAGGYKSGSSINNTESEGGFWMNCLYDINMPRELHITSEIQGYTYRSYGGHYGRSVRPVCP